MKPKIGIYGSAVDEGSSTVTKAIELGVALSREDVTLITGAAVGMPYQVVVAAKEKNPALEVWEYAPCSSLAEYRQEYPKANHSLFSQILYIPSDFPFISNISACRKYRNVISTATCDAGIIISGRWGTLNEFTNLIDFGKVIGVLTGTGGIADELVSLHPRVQKKNLATVLFDSSADALVASIIRELRTRGE